MNGSLLPTSSPAEITASGILHFLPSGTESMDWDIDRSIASGMGIVNSSISRKKLKMWTFCTQRIFLEWAIVRLFFIYYIGLVLCQQASWFNSKKM